MQYIKIICVVCASSTKHSDTLLSCEMQNFVKLQQVDHIVTTVLQTHKRFIDTELNYVFHTTNEMQLIKYSLLLSAHYMFRAVFPPIIRSL